MSTVKDEPIDDVLGDGKPSDEESGDDVFDSSEEEELDDDEEEAQRVREGFIVDEDEEEEQVSRKRRRKKHRRREEDDDRLDEDDLDLLMENTGASRPESKHKRLKRVQDEEPEGPEPRGDVLNDFFSDEEDAAKKGGDFVDELDDFIEDDEFSDEDEDTRQERMREKQQRQQRRKEPMKVSGLSSDKIDEMYDIFGDGHDYDWALAIEDEELEQDEEGTKKKVTLTDMYDMQDLKKNLMTEEDAIIKRTDVPERYQELRAGVTNYGQLSSDDTKLEQLWIVEQLSQDKGYPVEASKNELLESISSVLRFITEEDLEVPFIFNQRRDYLSNRLPDLEYSLTENDLWQIVFWDIEFHSIIQKREVVKNFYSSLDVVDSIAEEFFNTESVGDLSSLQDLYNYLEFKYAEKLPAVKRHTKNSAYNRFRNSPLYSALAAIGISSEDAAQNLAVEKQLTLVVDPETTPIEVIQKIADENPAEISNANMALETVKKFYAMELSYNPKLKQKLRATWRDYYKVDIELTAKGRAEIQEGSPYMDFKYAINRVQAALKKQPDTFLRMLAAEAQHMVSIKMSLVGQDEFLTHLFANSMQSSNTTELAQHWNSFRRSALDLALAKVIPSIAQEMKDTLQKDCENLIFAQVRRAVCDKLDRAPYFNELRNKGKTHRALAITCGTGRFGTDAVIGAYLNSKGEFVKDYRLVENPRKTRRSHDDEKLFSQSFVAMVQDCKPQVIGVNGPNAKTYQFYELLTKIIRENRLTNDKGGDLRVVFVEDEVAQRYQQSQRAAEEFAGKPRLVRYAVALARYLQSPLCEYANLSDDEMTSLDFHPHQNLLPADKLRWCIETAFVDVVNMVGVDINRTTDNTYYSKLLPYVAGFGKRKAVDLLQSLQRLNDPLLARQQFITSDIMGKVVFMNSASFLYIDSRTKQYGDLQYDPLDGTRIHPEDYELACKVAADALDVDVAEVEAASANHEMSEFVERLLKLDDIHGALKQLDVKNYAVQLEEQLHRRQLSNLKNIVEELCFGYAELRMDFVELSGVSLFRSLTGEDDKSFQKGFVIPVRMERIRRYELEVLTNSGISCTVTSGNFEDSASRPASEIYEIGKTYPAKIVYVSYDTLSVEVTLRENEVRNPFIPQLYYREPEIWDLAQEARDTAIEDAKTASEEKAKRIHRVIKHPYYFPFNGKQAEDYLRGKERGDVVIRQSSRSDDHLVITWKLDKDLFQHVEILEIKNRQYMPDGTLLEQTRYEVVGSKTKQTYDDLDHIIDQYIGTMVRLLNEMTSNEKFHKGTQKDTSTFIEDYSKVNPHKSVYALCFNHKHPGWFYLMFKINAKSKMYVWNVELRQDGFVLSNYSYPTVIALCNGFKTVLKNQMTQGPAKAYYANY